MAKQVGSVDIVLDHDAALRRFGGNLAALKRSGEAFLQGCPGRLEEMRQAVSAGDARALRRAAYRMDWDLSRLSAGAAFQAALRLERMGKDGDLEGAASALALLEREVEMLSVQLRTMDV
jgi:hypothetical protein